MKNIKERVAYLQGLAQGLDINDSTNEGRVLNGIIGVLADMANQLDDIEMAHTDLEEYVESIDEDLNELETEFFDGEADGDMIEVECPRCSEIVCFESELADDEDLIEVTCPNCDEVVYVNDEDALSGTYDDANYTNSLDDDL